MFRYPLPFLCNCIEIENFPRHEYVKSVFDQPLKTLPEKELFTRDNTKNPTAIVWKFFPLPDTSSLKQTVASGTAPYGIYFFHLLMPVSKVLNLPAREVDRSLLISASASSIGERHRREPTSLFGGKGIRIVAFTLDLVLSLWLLKTPVNPRWASREAHVSMAVGFVVVVRHTQTCHKSVTLLEILFNYVGQFRTQEKYVFSSVGSGLVSDHLKCLKVIFKCYNCRWAFI